MVRRRFNLSLDALLSLQMVLDLPPPFLVIASCNNTIPVMLERGNFKQVKLYHRVNSRSQLKPLLALL